MPVAQHKIRRWRRPAPAAGALVEAFLGKGVRTVIGTLWPVNDSSAASFSAAFYRFFFACQLHASHALLLTKRRYAAEKEAVDMLGYVAFARRHGADAQILHKPWMVDERP